MSAKPTRSGPAAIGPGHGSKCARDPVPRLGWILVPSSGPYLVPQIERKPVPRFLYFRFLLLAKCGSRFFQKSVPIVLLFLVPLFRYFWSPTSVFPGSEIWNRRIFQRDLQRVRALASTAGAQLGVGTDLQSDRNGNHIWLQNGYHFWKKVGTTFGSNSGTTFGKKVGTVLKAHWGNRIRTTNGAPAST